jgi:hypothetical protein
MGICVRDPQPALQDRVSVRCPHLPRHDRRIRLKPHRAGDAVRSHLSRSNLFLHQPIDFEDAYRNKKDPSVGTFSIPLTGIGDLIKMKRQANREQDRSDIQALEQLLRLREGDQS